MPRSVVDALLASDEPSVRWKVWVKVLGEDPAGLAARRLQDEIRRSATVRALLDGQAGLRIGVYHRWQGAHWVLLALADLGYPAGDPQLRPLADAVTGHWLAERYFREVTVGPDGGRAAASVPAVPVLDGLYRRCASQQGGALLAAARLGLGGDHAARLAERLLHWQWPDGGWNCDRRAGAHGSSVYETLLPMRALAAYARAAGDEAARRGAGRASEVLLTRRLAFRRSTGRPVRREWLQLHYPVYWRYDILAGLKGLAETGRIGDPRCGDALDLLQGKGLPGGGWAADAAYFYPASTRRHSGDYVDWGQPAAGRMNEWVTADALAVLAAAGRL